MTVKEFQGEGRKASQGLKREDRRSWRSGSLKARRP
jgi:hypothetical protein